LITIEEFLEKHSADTLRYLLLNSGYRNPLTFSEDVLEQAERALSRLRSGFKPAMPGASGASQSSLDNLAKQVEQTRKTFVESMDDDFNSSGALAGFCELVRVINQTRADGATDAQLADAQHVLRELTSVLGLRLEYEKTKGQAADAFVDALVELRAELRKQKLWALSDMVRDRLTRLGVTLEDSKDGSSWRWTE
jgi:cysteinyl-tRNA synthetase